MEINYRSIGDLNSAILSNLHRFPHDIDLVVGIPRSGMLPANLIALYLNKPYTDIDSFVEGSYYGHGRRLISGRESNVKKILLVDDSLAFGNSMQQAIEKVKGLNQEVEYETAVVYVSEEGQNMVNIACEVVPLPRFFQWNVFHHPGFIPHSFFDIDGVLCENPPVDDDGPKYIGYISNAPTKFIPTYEIDTIVSCRLEKYRAITEDWLSRNNIKYKRLVLLDLPSRSARIKWGKYGEFKGRLYKDSNAGLFIESSLSEAKEIVKMSLKPVFCTETFALLDWESEAPFLQAFGHRIHVLLWKIKIRIISCRNSFKK